MGSEDTALEAGLGFVCALDKPGGSIGPDAPPLHRDEPIRRDGRIVGRVTSGGQGHWLGHPVALGYVGTERGVDAMVLDTGRCEIESADRCWPATASLRAPYDPIHSRMRG